MSFGVVQSMITSLRNNSRRKQLTHFDRKGMALKGSIGNFDELLKRKATPEQLAEIREKIKTEKRKVLIKTIVISIFLLIIIYIGIKLLF